MPITCTCMGDSHLPFLELKMSYLYHTHQSISFIAENNRCLPVATLSLFYMPLASQCPSPVLLWETVTLPFLEIKMSYLYHTYQSISCTAENNNDVCLFSGYLFAIDLSMPITCTCMGDSQTFRRVVLSPTSQCQSSVHVWETVTCHFGTLR